MIGLIISHYKVLEKLGEGGMGVVYKAEDIMLKRPVALKFLPKGLEAHEPERARFLQEAQAASAINHPHVCTYPRNCSRRRSAIHRNGVRRRQHPQSLET